MHEYSNVDVTPLDDKQLNEQKGQTSNLSIKKTSEKSYSILVKNGNSFIFINKKILVFILSLDSSNELAINVDESLETVRTGSASIVISLPKQKHLSYLLKFSSQEGKSNRDLEYLYMYVCVDFIL